MNLKSNYLVEQDVLNFIDEKNKKINISGIIIESINKKWNREKCGMAAAFMARVAWNFTADKTNLIRLLHKTMNKLNEEYKGNQAVENRSSFFEHYLLKTLNSLMDAAERSRKND